VIGRTLAPRENGNFPTQLVAQGAADRIAAGANSSSSTGPSPFGLGYCLRCKRARSSSRHWPGLAASLENCLRIFSMQPKGTKRIGGTCCSGPEPAQAQLGGAWRLCRTGWGRPRAFHQAH